MLNKQDGNYKYEPITQLHHFHKNDLLLPCRRTPSPVPPFEGAAVFGVIIELGHALFKTLPDWTLLQEGQRQLVLLVHKRLRGRERCGNSAMLIGCCLHTQAVKHNRIQ